MRQSNFYRQNINSFNSSQQKRIQSDNFERQEKSNIQSFNNQSSRIFNQQITRQIHEGQEYSQHYEDTISQNNQAPNNKKDELIDLKYFLKQGEIYFMYGIFLIYTVVFLLFILLVYGIYKIYLNTSNNYCDDDTNFMNICKLSNGYMDVASNQSYIIQVLLFICLTLSQVIRFKFGIYDIFKISTNKYLIDQIKGEKNPTSYTVKISNIKSEDNLEENILLYFNLLQNPRVKIRCITFCYDMKIIDKLNKIKQKANQKSEGPFVQQGLTQKIINRQEKEIKSQDLFNGIAYITFDRREEKESVIKYRKNIISKFSQLWNTKGEYLQKYRKLKQQIESQAGKTYYQPSEWYEGITISEPEQPTDIIWSNQIQYLSKLPLILLWGKIVLVILVGIVCNILFIFYVGDSQLSSLNTFQDNGSTSGKASFIILSIIIPLFSQIINKFIRFLVYGGFKQIFSKKSDINLIYIILLPLILSLNEVIYLAIIKDRICQMQIEWMNMFLNLVYPFIQVNRMFNFPYSLNLSNLIFGNKSSYLDFKNRVTKDKDKKQIKINLWFIFVVKIFYNTIATCQSNPFSIVFYFASVFGTLYVQKMLLKYNYLKPNFCPSDLCRIQDFQFSIGLLVISITQISRLQKNESQDFKIQLAINIITVASTFLYTIYSLYSYIKYKQQLKKDNDDENQHLEMELSSVDSNNSQTYQNEQKNQKIEDLELKYSYFQQNPVNLYMAEQREFYVKLLKPKDLGIEGKLSQHFKLDKKPSLNSAQNTLVGLFNQICQTFNEIAEKGKDEMYRQPDKKDNKVSNQFSEFELKSFFIEDSILNLINIYLEITKNNVSIKKQTMFLNSLLSSQLLGKYNQNIN
ncbi:hypothetical protein ABPG73_001649 [Tetrahymena malaccensis]